MVAATDPRTTPGDPPDSRTLPLLLHFSHIPLKGDREALVTEKPETREKVCDSGEDSSILNWASSQSCSVVQREVFKNITDLHLCIVMLEYRTRETSWIDEVILQNPLVLHGTRGRP